MLIASKPGNLTRFPQVTPSCIENNVENLHISPHSFCPHPTATRLGIQGVG